MEYPKVHYVYFRVLSAPQTKINKIYVWLIPYDVRVSLTQSFFSTNSFNFLLYKANVRSPLLQQLHQIIKTQIHIHKHQVIYISSDCSIFTLTNMTAVSRNLKKLD